MFQQIFLFELKYRFTRPATWAYFAILFIFALFVSIGGIGPASEKVFVNSPTAIANILATISIFGIMLASAIMGVPVYRDIEHSTQNYYFSYPISEKGYVLGRFLGSLITLLFVSLGLILGLIIGFEIGPYAGFVEPERFTDFNFYHYLQPILVFYWSNLIVAGCIFFALVSLTKKIMLAYAGGAILFIAYLVTLTLASDIENKDLVSLLDPFGLGTFDNATQYWTPEEQNTRIVKFDGFVMYNRLLWLAVGISIFLFALFRFDFQRFLNKKLGSKKTGKKEEAISSSGVLTKIPSVARSYSFTTNWKLMLQLSWMEFKNIIKDNFFKAILIAAVLFLFFDAWFGFPIYGTESLPMTYYMLEVKSFTYVILIFILIVFMTGEVLHRERGVGYNQIFGSLPLPNWVIYGSKFLALVIVSFLLVNMILVSGLFNQVLKGYYQFELDMYLKDLYLLEFPKYISFIMLAFFIHALVAKKFLGHVITIAIWTFLFGLNSIGNVNYNMFLYGYTPGYTLSDMNGFGHLWNAQLSFRFYWLSLGAVLTLIGMLLWNRTADTGWKARWTLLKNRLTPLSGSALLIATLLWLGLGAYIYYNVSVLNTYRTVKEGRLYAANYEKKLSKYAFINQPKIFDVKVAVDLLPEDREATILGHFKMTNKTMSSIENLHLNWGGSGYFKRDMKVFTIDGKKPNLIENFEDYGYEIYEFDEPLKPGDTVEMILNIRGYYEGFPNEGNGSEIVHNGTFLNNGIFPGFGYSAQAELNSDIYRKKYDLPIKDYAAPKQDDPWGLENLLFNDDADYVTFEGTVSTAPNQIAIMPGYLKKQWQENGRNYFTYSMEDSEMDYFFNVSSAEYEVLEEQWSSPNGDQVTVEIYYDEKHPFNIDLLSHSVKKSLDYFHNNFGPYQYRQMRILEFPRYQSFAQSFPNTVPYAESFGWVGDFSDPNDIDYAFMVTAHEVAHQWWGHQITPSATRGANQISETMAEYSSLMVMKKEYGVDAMQKFLKEELDRYLRSRANESKFEKTLLDNDTQSYVWYRKGGLIMYALQDYVGEDSLNVQLKNFVSEAAFRPKAPFATSLEWYEYLQAATPDSLKYFLEDSFEKITLYSNKMEEASYKKLENGKFEVTLNLSSIKTYYDGNGKRLEEPKKANLLEVGVFAADQKNEQGMVIKAPLVLEKKWITPGETTLTFIVDKEPVKAGIDPYNKMIDRIPDDNIRVVEMQE